MNEDLETAHTPFTQLPFMPGTDERHSWDVFGDRFEFGCLNHIGPDAVLSASKLITVGQVVNLNLALDQPAPAFWAGHRGSPDHQVLVRKSGRDDFLNQFYLQGSTQWDGFRHARYKEHGYYGWKQEADLDATDVLGIDRWAERGLVGRGVLIDAQRYFRQIGEPLVHGKRHSITGAMIEDIARSQNVVLKSGDILLLHTGWLGWYMKLPDSERQGMAARFRDEPRSFELPGLSAGRDTAAWLWDHRVAAIASDTPTLEALPYHSDEGWAHQRILALLGLPFGELWRLEELADECGRLGRYEFFLTSAPLYLTRGVGTPANAYAIL